MNIYMISYDLHDKTTNREKVIESITSLGEWCKCVSTTYLIKTSLSHDSVVNAVMEHIHADDEMIICDVNGRVSGQLKTELQDRVLRLLQTND